MSKPKLIDTRAPKGEYIIAFATEALQSSGFITGVKVTIEPTTLGPDESTRIDLTDHPLYPHLRQYVLSNLKDTR